MTDRKRVSKLKRIGEPLVETHLHKTIGLRFLLLLVFASFLSGACALSHELLWTRRLIDLLGATEWVIGRVLGLFFFGISLGGYLATRRFGENNPAVISLLRVEILIGILALPAAFLPFWTDWIWPFIGPDFLVSWIGSVLKFLLTILVVFPPAVAMGFTLPLFIRAATDHGVTEQGANVASVGVWVYAINTLGGVFGLWFSSTYLLGWVGAQNSMILVSITNVLVAVTLWVGFQTSRRNVSVVGDAVCNNVLATSRDRGSDASSNSENIRTTDNFDGNFLYGLAFVSGFVVLGLEVLLLRLINLVVPSSYHTTSAMLANVILILAVGSFLVSLTNLSSVTRVLAKNKLVIAAAFSFAAVFTAACPISFYDATNELISVRYLQALDGETIESIGHYWSLVFWLVAVSGGLALLFLGLIFPMILTISSEKDPAGKRVGYLLAINGIGGLLGTEIFNSLVVSLFGIYDGFVILAILLLTIAGGALVVVNRWLALGGTMALFLFIFSSYQYVVKIPYLSPNAKNVKAKEEHFGRDGVWLIVEKPSGAKGILVNNQYFLGGSGATVVQRRELLIPWLLNPKAETVCCLGLATGITSSGLEILDNPPPITAVELSGNVVSLAKKYFRNESGAFFERPDNQVVTEDARIFMAAARNQFDLIVGDLYRPFGIGEGRLYSVEHFQNVRDALTDDGVFCQWLPVYQLNEENLLTIAATFQKVFPEVLIVYGDPNPNLPIIGLVGSKNGSKWKKRSVSSLVKNVPAAVLEKDPLLKNFDALVAGVLKPNGLHQHKINTLDNLEVEISAGTHWTLKDLRKKRNDSYENEFLIGQHFLRFNKRFEKLIDSLLPPERFQQLLKSIELNARKRKK